MSQVDDLIALFDGLQSRSPAGFAIGLHLNYTTSKYIFQTYSRQWMEEYSRRGLLLGDPTVRWGLENTGSIRWSELEASDPAGVISSAKTFGLEYGVTVAVADSKAGSGSRSLGSFASPEEEFADSAIDLFERQLLEMHDLAAAIEPDSIDDKRVKRFAASLAGVGFHDL